MTRPANAIDFWRGIALITIFINHVPGLYYEQFTHRNVSISDSADLFVFLAGWAVALVMTRPKPPLSAARVVSRLWARALVIYAVHIMIIMLAVALLAFSARSLDNPLLLEWHNAAAVFYSPTDTHIGLVLLSHQLGYFDILPLYVVLMLMAPAVVLIDRYLPSNGLIVISLALYFGVLIFRINLPSWPNNGQWFFNPLAWQLMFVLGYVIGQDRGFGAWARRNLDWLRLAAVPIVIAGALVVWFGWWPDPTKMPEPRLLFIASKTFVTPMRVLQFVALVAVFSAAFPHILRALPRLADFCSMLGRNSLNVFCMGSVLSLGCQVIRFIYKDYIGLDTMILIVGIFVLGLTAWVSEWQERFKKTA